MAFFKFHMAFFTSNLKWLSFTIIDAFISYFVHRGLVITADKNNDQKLIKCHSLLACLKEVLNWNTEKFGNFVHHI